MFKLLTVVLLLTAIFPSYARDRIPAIPEVDSPAAQNSKEMIKKLFNAASKKRVKGECPTLIKQKKNKVRYQDKDCKTELLSQLESMKDIPHMQHQYRDYLKFKQGFLKYKHR